MKPAGRVLFLIKAAVLASLSVAAAILLAVAVTGEFPSFPNRLPLFGGARDFPTRTFASVAEDTATLKVSRYDVDFLASFAGKAGRYVAVVPYVVEVSVPLGSSRKIPGKKTVEVPLPAYSAHLDAERGSSLVLADSLDPDYNSVLAPVLEAYRMKSLDCALSDAEFVADARAKAESAVAALFPGSEIAWKDSGEAALAVRASDTLPARFSYAASGDVSFDAPPCLRDDALIASSLFGNSSRVPLRFGFSAHSGLSFDALSRAIVSANSRDHIVFRYHDPINPGAATFFSYADEGYKTAYAYLAGANDVYYVDAVVPANVNDEYSLRHVASNVLYFAASLSPAPEPARARESRRYIENHARALDEVRAGRFGRTLENAVMEMEKVVGEKGVSDRDLEAFRKLLAASAGSYGIGGDSSYSGTVAVLEALAASDYGTLSSALRASGEIAVRDDAVATANLQSLLWTMRDAIGIPPIEADAYRRDLISSGVTVSQSLVNSLDAADRNALYANYLKPLLAAGGDSVAWVDPDDDSETIIFYGKGAAEWRARHMPQELQERFASLGLKRGNRLVVFFSDPPDRGGLFASYHALALDGYSVTACRDVTAWIRLAGKPERVPFSEVDVDGGKFSVGTTAFRNEPALASALSRFRDAFSSPTWNRDELVRFIREGLSRELVAALSRPTPKLY